MSVCILIFYLNNSKNWTPHFKIVPPLVLYTHLSLFGVHAAFSNLCFLILSDRDSPCIHPNNRGLF